MFINYDKKPNKTSEYYWSSTNISYSETIFIPYSFYCFRLI